MTEEVGPVREEAERLVAVLLARFGAVGGDAYADPDRAGRLAQAAGDVAVAVTGLLRELSRPSGDGVHPAAGLRESFAGFAGGLIEAAGVDLHGDPPPADPPPWRAGTEAEDPWRAATRDAAARDAAARDAAHDAVLHGEEPTS
ncbi:MAG: hypothetical protein ACRDT4_06400 [Micromonosporaceae bacterium]